MKRYIYLDIDGFTEEDYKVLFPFASMERKKKIEKYRFFKDRRLSLLAYLLYIYGVQREYGIKSSHECEIGDNGKPYIEDNKFYFNISHTARGVMAVFDNQNIGCDIEGEAEHIFLPRDIFSKNEIELIKNSKQANKLFTQIWTLKESYVKCEGMGLTVSLNDIDFAPYIGHENNEFKYRDKYFTYEYLEYIHCSVCSSIQNTPSNISKGNIIISKESLIKEVMNGR